MRGLTHYLKVVVAVRVAVTKRHRAFEGDLGNVIRRILCSPKGP